jgi:ATP-binding cassette subfamily B (MDR/TAP) protein 1
MLRILIKVKGLTKAQSAANYIFWIRSLKPKVAEDFSKPGPPTNDEDPKPLSLRANEVDFAYPLRPNIPVIRGLDAEVSSDMSKMCHEH